MLGKKYLAGAVLAAVLTFGAGQDAQQAQASPLTPQAIQITAGDTIELGRHHRDGHYDRRHGHRPKHVSHHRGHGPRHYDRHPPRHRHHSSGSSIAGGIIGGIIGGILVNSSK